MKITKIPKVFSTNVWICCRSSIPSIAINNKSLLDFMIFKEDVKPLYLGWCDVSYSESELIVLAKNELGLLAKNNSEAIDQYIGRDVCFIFERSKSNSKFIVGHESSLILGGVCFKLNPSCDGLGQIDNCDSINSMILSCLPNDDLKVHYFTK